MVHEGERSGEWPCRRTRLEPNAPTVTVGKNRDHHGGSVSQRRLGHSPSVRKYPLTPVLVLRLLCPRGGRRVETPRSLCLLRRL